MVRRALLALFIAVALAGAGVSGQQPNRKPEPYVAPLLPGDLAWMAALPSPPAAGGAMDDDRVYVPLQPVATTVDGARVVAPDSATVAALSRRTGLTVWTATIESGVAPLVHDGRVIVAAGTDLRALDSESGKQVWAVPLGGRVRGSMLARGNLVVALLDPDELIAIRLDTREVAWRALAGAKSTLMNGDDRAVYVTTADSRIVSIRLADGSTGWQRQLEGRLGEPAVGRDRVLVGSTTDSLWAIDADSGDHEWAWHRRVFGGDVLGAAFDGDVSYVVSLDNIVRAINRSGNQLWKRTLPTRPVHPPRAFFGTVVVVGLAPPVSTFLAKTGAPVASWVPPPPTDAELQGPPLIDQHLKPFGVAMVVILRDGRVLGVRPTAMTFPEAPILPMKAVPGRGLPPERPPGITPQPPAGPSGASR